MSEIEPAAASVVAELVAEKEALKLKRFKERVRRVFNSVEGLKRDIAEDEADLAKLREELADKEKALLEMKPGPEDEEAPVHKGSFPHHLSYFKHRILPYEDQFMLDAEAVLFPRVYRQ